MNWLNVLERIHKADRQQLIRFAHLAGCWHTCPTAALDIPRAALYEPVDARLFLLGQKFHRELNTLVSLWEELHFYNRSKKFYAIQKLAIKILNQIKKYERNTTL